MNRIKYLILFIEAVCIVVWFSRLFIEGFVKVSHTSTSAVSVQSPSFLCKHQFMCQTVAVWIPGSDVVLGAQLGRSPSFPDRPHQHNPHSAPTPPASFGFQSRRLSMKFMSKSRVSNTVEEIQQPLR